MFLIECITQDHDLRLVGIAALVCAFGALVTVRLFLRTRRSRGPAHLAWLFIASLAGGASIWCTHFVAMIAYRPGASVSYEPSLTVGSFVIAILGCGLAIGVGALRRPGAAEAGGALFGLGVGAMHYIGMAAFMVEGVVAWRPEIVGGTVLAAVLLGSLIFNRAVAERPVSAPSSAPPSTPPSTPPSATAEAGRPGARRAAAIARLSRGEIPAAALMALAIVTLHFGGMSAMSITPFAPLDGAKTGEDAQGLLGAAVAGAGLLIVAASAVTQALDRQLRKRSDDRMRALADTSADGVVVQRAGVIVEANPAFLAMIGAPRAAVLGKRFETFVVGPLAIDDGEIALIELRESTGSGVPVEIVVRSEPEIDDEGEAAIFSLRDRRPRLAQERRLVQLAQHDSLTSLLNRAAFMERLELSIHGSGGAGADRRFALIAIDLDRFKEINDVHGHAAGDLVLRTVAERLRETLPAGSDVARLGGDEFVALAPTRDAEDAMGIACAIQKALSVEVVHGASDLRCGASVGIALFPDDGDSASTLLNNADLAMYRAKGSGETPVVAYDSAMGEEIRTRLQLVQELRDALARDQFELRYQVQVALQSERATGYEALLRWRHPERGYISPAEFIPIAEETGLIVPIGEWVLRTACRAATTWRTSHRVSVNLSAVQLSSGNLPELVASVLAETGLAPERLELEVTETSLIRDPARAQAVLGAVKALGVSIAIDDFGTGYSSLSTLQSFRFDKIKLDRSFLVALDGDEQAIAILHAVIALGGSLNIPVLVEGVETVAQLEILRKAGCQEVQGFLYGRPEPTIVAPVSLRVAALAAL